MADVIKAADLAKRVGQILEQYQTTTELSLKEAVDEASNEIKKDLRQTSPKRTGAYARSWDRTSNTIRKGARGYARTVFNRNHYRLTHLLEYGHATKGGGRTQAQPHIAAAEERGVAEFEQKLLRKLEQ